jgi:hypothetical protein
MKLYNQPNGKRGGDASNEHQRSTKEKRFNANPTINRAYHNNYFGNQQQVNPTFQTVEKLSKVLGRNAVKSEEKVDRQKELESIRKLF